MTIEDLIKAARKGPLVVIPFASDYGAAHGYEMLQKLCGLTGWIVSKVTEEGEVNERHAC